MRIHLCRKEMLSWLEQILEEYDRIILARGQEAARGLGAALGRYPALQNGDGKVLILSDMGNGDAPQTGSVVWRRIPAREMMDILDMYHLYEFSDRVISFSREDNVGSLLNYVDTGVFTMDEAAEALLKLSPTPLTSNTS